MEIPDRVEEVDKSVLESIDTVIQEEPEEDGDHQGNTVRGISKEPTSLLHDTQTPRNVIYLILSDSLIKSSDDQSDIVK